MNIEQTEDLTLKFRVSNTDFDGISHSVRHEIFRFENSFTQTGFELF